MHNIRIWYDEAIGKEDVPEAVGKMFINCGKLLLLVRQSNDRKLHN